MVMGKHRNAHNLLADAMNRVAQLKVRVAKDIVNDDPAIQAVDTKIDDIKRAMLKINRWLDPDHGLANSIEKWTLRIADAKENLANAEASKKSYLADLKELKAERNTLALDLAKDAEVEADELVSDIQV